MNHPKDPGGPTMRGVTKKVWDAWRLDQGLPLVDVRQVTKRDAENIFAQQYFDPIMFDKLPIGLDYCMADFAVNSGPPRAIKTLQRYLNSKGHGIAVDGFMGVITLGAIASEPYVNLIIEGVCNRRMAFLKRLKTWSEFGAGWTRRVMGEEWGAQEADKGVIDRAVRMTRNNNHFPDPKPAPGKTGETLSWRGWLLNLIGVSA